MNTGDNDTRQLQRGKWLRIVTAGTMHDIPRTILLLDREFVFWALDCPFDEANDDYSDEYSAYRIGHNALDAKAWFQSPENLDAPTERIHVSHLEFDETRRNSLFVHARRQTAGEKQPHDASIATLRLLMTFSQSAKARRMIQEIALEPKQTFWVMTINALFNTAAVDWCKVFGSRSEDTHWTRAIPRHEHETVRTKLLEHIGLCEDEWNEYRDEIVSFRNRLVAHLDLVTTPEKYPNFDIALKAAHLIHAEVRQRADQRHLGDIPRSLDHWSESVTRNMRCIVEKAFDATSQLGPNIANAMI